VPYEEDVTALKEDIRKAKRQADVVIVSIHWGLRLVPKTICTYQPPIAHAAIDAGADLILGHHAHSIKAGSLQGQGLLLQRGQPDHLITTGAPRNSPSTTHSARSEASA
jgi:hypothetical protein